MTPDAVQAPAGAGGGALSVGLNPCNGKHAGRSWFGPDEQEGTLGTFEVVAAIVHAIPALVWIVVAESSWRMVRTKQSESRFFWLLPVVAAGVGLTYTIFTFVCLFPAELRAARGLPVLLAYAIHDCVLFIMIASARHLTRYFPTPERPPGFGWLVVNYGSGVAMCVLCLAFLDLIRIPGVTEGFAAYPSLRIIYQLVWIGLIVAGLLPIIQPGGMTAGMSGWIGARRSDAFFLIGAMVTLIAWLVLAGTTGWTRGTLWHPTPWGVALDAVAGFGFAAPMAARFLGHIVRSVIVILCTGLAAAAVCFAAVPTAVAAIGEGYAPLVNLAALIALILIFLPGRALLLHVIDASLLQRDVRRRDELQQFMQTLSPKLGAAECSRRALAELGRVMRLRGAALLFGDAETVVCGRIEVTELERLGLGRIELGRALLGNELREFPDAFRDALAAADIVGIVPVASPRRQRGLLLLATDLLGAMFTDDEEHALRGFADQLALVLDGVELLATAVAAQRSLAHAEKLAAVGELAARVAHEIRNPVTAARSLAQQLCREPTSPLNAEHAALIVEEMERVERRIAALLQYARKEEFRPEPVDLTELAENAGRAFATRFDEGGVAFRCNANGPVTASVDRERIRQVLINLIENALDALSLQESRRLCLDVVGSNGTAEIRVTDNGPGVDSETLGRLFDPFFSLKAKGTGLGLAIAKRIVEAHGGELSACRVATGGLQFIVKLPSAVGG